MKNKHLSIIFTAMIIALAFLTVTGCDEGMNMVDPIIKPGPGKDDPKTPTLTIDTATQMNDGSVIIVGSGVNLPEGTEVTVVLGDDAITVTATTDKTGAWLATVFAEKTANLVAGTVAVRAAAGEATAESSFEHTPPPEPVEPHENDFVGQVVTLIDNEDARWRTHPYAHAVPEVTLIVVSGERAGEQSVTDQEGNYRFSDPARTTLRLHLRAEGEGYEPKEVIVHRSEPTEILDDGVVFSLRKDAPQKTPGTILIGHAWPDKVRFILENTLLPHDLLLVRVDELPKNYGGLYWDGVVLIENGGCPLRTISHELGHAHQHAVAAKEMGPSATAFDWEDTPEGKAYFTAQEKDWEEVGKISQDGGYLLTPIENMAATAKNYWNMVGKLDTPLCFSIVKLKEDAPNRYKWAQKWLNKK